MRRKGSVKEGEKHVADLESMASPRRSTVFDETRQQGINVILDQNKAFEDARKERFQTVTQSSRTHWRAVLITLDDAVAEHRSAIAFLEIKIAAEKAYAQALFSLHPKCNSGKIQKRGSLTSRHVDKTNKKKEAALDLHQVLQQSIAAQASVAKQHEEFAKYLELELLENAKSMMKKGTNLIQSIENKGKEMQGVVADTDKETRKMYQLCVESTNPTPQEQKTGNIRDVWLSDTRYRLMANLCDNTLNKLKTDLQLLFDEAHAYELERRQSIFDIFHKFSARQEELWQSLPEVQQGAMEEILEMPIESHDVERDFSEKISTRESVIRKESLDESDFPFEQLGLIDDEPESTLGSPLMLRSQVIERKREGNLSGGKKKWIPTFIIITADRYLHLFDLPKAVTVDSSDEAAFRAIEPREVEDLTKASAHWLKGGFMQPFKSYKLRDCKCELNPETASGGKRKEPAFTLAEKTNNTGAVGLFKKTSTRHITLKCADNDQVVQWVNLIEQAPEVTA